MPGPSSGLPATFSPQAGRRGYAAPFSSFLNVAWGKSPLPACGERVRVRGNPDQRNNAGGLPFVHSKTMEGAPRAPLSFKASSSCQTRVAISR